MTVRLTSIVLLGLCAVAAQAEEVTISSPATPVMLVELYTSEGCSSCPPADRWLAELVDTPARLWTQVVPVAYHVTYWDYLGWRDRFAQPQFDERQRRLARRVGTSVYTPGVFAGGREWRSWRRGRWPQAAASEAAGVLAARVGERQVAVHFASTATDGELRVHLAWLGEGESRVERGENRGRHLRHAFVVQSLTQQPLEAGDDGVWRAVLPRHDAGKASSLALWVSDAAGNVLQAAGGSL